MTNEDNAAFEAAEAAFAALDASPDVLPNALPEGWREKRDEDARRTAAIQDGRIAVYAIAMGITMQVNGDEFTGTANWKHTADDGAEMDFDNKNIDWFEANCELLDIDWDDECADHELDG